MAKDPKSLKPSATKEADHDKSISGAGHQSKVSPKVSGSGPVDARERTEVVNEGRRLANWQIEPSREKRAEATQPPITMLAREATLSNKSLPTDDGILTPIIGGRGRKIDGHSKATGSAQYADDLTLPGMLHGKILRSPHPHAEIVSIDVSAALALEGVHGVITGADLPEPYGIIPWTHDETALAVEKVLFVGDAVAAVAAVDEETAYKACRLINIEYTILEPIFDPQQALDNPDHKLNPFARKGNVTKRVDLSFGEIDEALKGGAATVSEDYFFCGNTHGAIEPHCALAKFEPSPHAQGMGTAASTGMTGQLTVWSSTQIPHYLHRELSRVLGLQSSRVRVIQPTLGGAFGGKSDPFDLEFCVAKLAMVTGRPVKILYTREEVFLAHRGRHPMAMHFELSAERDGRLRGVRSKILIDGGAYASYGLVTAYYAGQLLTGPYDFPTYAFEATRVYTNKPPCGPKRGHGSVQPRFAFEVALDELAEKLAMDPMEIRRRNFQGEGVATVNGQRITSNGFDLCLNAVERSSEWQLRHGKLPYGKGLGVAGSIYISGTNYPIYPNKMPQSAVQIQLDRSGKVTIFSGASDLGQGSDSVVAWIACEELGCELADVRVVAADTDLCPVDLGAYSSRVTFMIGNATIAACKELRQKVRDVVAAHWDILPKQVALCGGLALDIKDTARQLPLKEAFVLAEEKYGTLGSVGHYNTPTLGGDYRGGTIGASPAYSMTAHVAEVDVDVETGMIEVNRVWAAHDCGRALNHTTVEGQIEGSVYMGLAEALMEEQVVYPRAGSAQGGLLKSASLLEYKMPTTLDTPTIDALVIESYDPEGPYGAKEAGEGPLAPIIPAIANAVYDAVGIRLRTLPFTPDRVWAALQELQETKERRD